jgi:RNA polymerase sigma-70 factor (ECF subfamily)
VAEVRGDQAGRAVPQEDPTFNVALQESDSKTDDRVLIQRTLDGDGEAFDALMERYVPVAMGYLCGRVAHLSDAEDLLQETFLTAYSSLQSLRRPDRFGPWLIAIARNKLTDARRREAARRRIGRRPNHMDAGFDPSAASRVVEETPAVSASFAETRQLVTETIGRLRDSYRMVLYLRLIEGLSPQEIAIRLGLKDGAVRVRLLRGLRKLRGLLVEQGIDASERRE